MTGSKENRVRSHAAGVVLDFLKETSGNNTFRFSLFFMVVVLSRIFGTIFKSLWLHPMGIKCSALLPTLLMVCKRQHSKRCFQSPQKFYSCISYVTLRTMARMCSHFKCTNNEVSTKCFKSMTK